MLVSMKEILIKAQEGGYGIIAPNVLNEDTARVCVEAAVEMEAPLIIDVAYVAHPDINMLASIIIEYARRVSVPIALNLDHGREFSHAMRAIQAGFTSIMVDRSKLPFDENVEQVSDIVKIAHSIGLDVEAELGHVGIGQNYEKDRDAGLTIPEQAKEYVDKTGIDFLAVAIGTAHGTYKGIPKLDFQRLKEIRESVDIPLVLHGGSGSGDDNLCKAISLGISKINLATDLFAEGRKNIKDDTPAHHIYYEVTEGYKRKLKYYIELFGQAGKA